jgi:hypothetical protein
MSSEVKRRILESSRHIIGSPLRSYINSRSSDFTISHHAFVKSSIRKLNFILSIGYTSCISIGLSIRSGHRYVKLSTQYIAIIGNKYPITEWLILFDFSSIYSGTCVLNSVSTFFSISISSVVRINMTIVAFQFFF